MRNHFLKRRVQQWGQGRKRDKFHNLARRVNFGRSSARETRNNVVVAQLGHYDGWRGEDAPPSPKFGWQKGRNKGRRTESVGRRCRRAARTIIVQILRYYSSPSHPPPSLAPTPFLRGCSQVARFTSFSIDSCCAMCPYVYILKQT